MDRVRGKPDGMTAAVSYLSKVRVSAVKKFQNTHKGAARDGRDGRDDFIL